MTNCLFRPVVNIVAVAAIVASLPAQWSSNPAINLSIGDLVSEQSLPKVAVASDGDCYIGWFDVSSGSYVVRLQHLDANGLELWPHNGIVVSSNPQSTSLVDWDLICDSNNHCVLAFTDTRSGSDLDVYAYRIAPNGTQTWGANGVALSNNADFEANPRICETSIGDFACVWPRDVTRTLQLQRIDVAGTKLYPGDGIAIPGDTGQSPAFARICASDNGAVILEWVRALSFSAAKHIHAQKYDLAGLAQWNGGLRLPVFDLASLPIAHDPKILADGQGGCVISWHFALGSAFSARVQRLSSAGIELFPHNGVDLSTNSNSKFDPAITWIPSLQSVIAFYNERNQGQSLWGISVQCINGIGAQVFGPTGINLLPINTDVKFAPVAVPLDFAGNRGANCFVLVQPAGLQTKNVVGMRIDENGVMQWTPVVFASTVASDKLRLNAAISRNGMSVLAWGDNRADFGNIEAQNVDAFGRLGDHSGSAISYGCGINPAGSLVAIDRPAFGSVTRLLMNNPLGTQASPSLAFMVLGFGAAPGYPCGVPVPGFGMAANGIGELLLDLAAPNTSSFVGFWLGNPSQFSLSIPLNLGLDGAQIYAQGALFDTSIGASNAIGLTQGMRLTIGF
jgi:hypothetical protein